MRFSGKVAIVTAGASGIGAAIVERLLAEGASVCISDINPSLLEAAANKFHKAGDRLITCAADAGDEYAVSMMIEEAASRFGKIDVLINNAGFSIRGKAGVLATSDWRKVLSVALDSVFFASRAALPYLLQGKGSIVNTASISGLFADYNFTAYATAKGGVVNLTRAMAVDYARDGVRVNAVCPGLVDTNLTHRFIENETTYKTLSERIPMRRAATPSEIAAAVAFLASAEASYITGVNLPVDGGVTAATGQPDFAALSEVLGTAGARPD